MATKASRAAARTMISPAVILLLGWMIIPLSMTIYFSFLRYNLITPTGNPFVGWENYYWFVTDPSFKAAMVNTLAAGRGHPPDHGCWRHPFRLASGPADVRPGDHPDHGDRAVLRHADGVCPRLEEHVHEPGQRHLRAYRHGAGVRSRSISSARSRCSRSSSSCRGMWLPFATLILFTAMQSLDQEQLEAAEMDGASWLEPVLVHHAAASGARDHRGDPDPDDLPAVGLRRDPRHHQRRSRDGDDQPDLPDLCLVAARSSTSAWAVPVASSPSSLPTSLPSS